VGVVAVVGGFLGGVGVDLHLGQAFAPRGVLERFGDRAGDFFVQDLAGEAEVGVGGGLGLRGAVFFGFGGGAVEGVVGVGGGGVDAAGAELFGSPKWPKFRRCMMVSMILVP
jgi:hypothetical protein